jgi:hypothetical protein
MPPFFSLILKTLRGEESEKDEEEERKESAKWREKQEELLT